MFYSFYTKLWFCVDADAWLLVECAAMDKYNNNTRFAPLRDAPFSLRGKYSWRPVFYASFSFELSTTLGTR